MEIPHKNLTDNDVKDAQDKNIILKKTRPISKVELFPFKHDGLQIPFIKDNKKIEKTLKEPILLLIKENRSVELLEDVKPGLLTVTVGENKAKLLLDEAKLLSFKHGSQSIVGWIHYEKEANPYPVAISHDSVEVEKLFRGVMLNYKEYENRGNKIDFGMLAGIALIILILGVVWANFIDKPNIPTGTVSNISNITKVITFVLFGW